MSKANQTQDVHTNGQTNSTPIPPSAITAAMEETLKLYHAWLGYLLTRQGADTLRVKAEDIRRALEQLSCTVSREGEEYVIDLRRGGEAGDEPNGEPCGG